MSPAELLQAIEDGQVDDAVAAINANPQLALEKLNQSGDTSIHIGAWQGYPPVVETALSHNAQVDSRGHLGRTALHYACLEGRNDVVMMLLAAGADPAAVDELGRNAMAFALSSGATDIVDALKDTGVDIPIEQAIVGGDWVKVESSLRAAPGALRGIRQSHSLLEDVVGQIDDAILDADTEDQSVIENVVEEWLPRLQLLIDNGAQVNGPSRRVPLYAAVQLSTPTVVRFLVERGATVDDATVAAAKDNVKYPEIMDLIHGAR